MKRIIGIIIAASFFFLSSCEKTEITNSGVHIFDTENYKLLQGTWKFDTLTMTITDSTVFLAGFDTMGEFEYKVIGSDTIWGNRNFSGEFYTIDKKSVLFHLDKTFLNNNPGYWGFAIEFEGEDSLWINRYDYGRYGDRLFLKQE
jgi:hypothetical protein